MKVEDVHVKNYRNYEKDFLYESEYVTDLSNMQKWPSLDSLMEEFKNYLGKASVCKYVYKLENNNYYFEHIEKVK